MLKPGTLLAHCYGLALLALIASVIAIPLVPSAYYELSLLGRADGPSASGPKKLQNAPRLNGVSVSVAAMMAAKLSEMPVEPNQRTVEKGKIPDETHRS